MVGVAWDRGLVGFSEQVTDLKQCALAVLHSVFPSADLGGRVAVAKGYGMAVVGLLIVWSACIAWYDFRQRRVPNALLILMAVPALLALIVNGAGLLGERWSSSVGGMAVGFGLTLPGYIMRRFGAGDVKFAAVLGLLLGVGRGFEMVLGASILMGITALALLALRRQMQARFPAAPMLGAAFVVEMLWGPLLVR